MAVLSLVLYYSFPGLPYHVPVATVLSKLYSNSALAIFNSRIHIVGGRESSNQSGTMHLSVSRGSRRPLTRTLDTILIQEDVYVHADDVPLERSVCIEYPGFMLLRLISTDLGLVEWEALGTLAHPNNLAGDYGQILACALGLSVVHEY